MINSGSVLEVIKPELVETRHSDFNGEIEVYRLWGKYSLSVNNLTQSGEMVEAIWSQVVSQVKTLAFQRHPPSAILILGLGGGSLVPILTKQWPQAAITALEIDPVMISLAGQYFGIKPSTRLALIQADAFDWIQHTSQTFDLVISDLYRGDTVPPQAKTTNFLHSLSGLLQPQGAVIVNHLVLQGMRPQAVAFRQKLFEIFPFVHRLKTPANWVFLAQKQPHSRLSLADSCPSKARKKPLK